MEDQFAHRLDPILKITAVILWEIENYYRKNQKGI